MIYLFVPSYISLSTPSRFSMHFSCNIFVFVFAYTFMLDKLSGTEDGFEAD
ncbi:hypothetical protein HanIR_Chr06g0298911 [Helianthus annuus]|nr:hypothetical protein HanIR_Chr06g0298911 [Helianthus annuus]